MHSSGRTRHRLAARLGLGALLALASGFAWGATPHQRAVKMPVSAPHYYYNGDQKMELYRAGDELDLVRDGPHPGLKELREVRETVRLEREQNEADYAQAEQEWSAKPGVRSVRAVYYRSAGGRAARDPKSRMSLPGRLAVRFTDGKDHTALFQRYGLATEGALRWLPGTVVLTAPDGPAALAAANAFYEKEGAAFALPLFKKPRFTRGTPNDPYFGNQWHLFSSTNGQDINAKLRDGSFVWDIFSGAGVKLAVVDDGLEINHEDLAPNVQAAICQDFNFSDPDPTPDNGRDNHGTACGGLAGARGNNGIGVCSAAPHVGLGGIRLISLAETDDVEAAALSFQSDQIDIYSNSWGPNDDGQTLEGPGPLLLAAFAANVTTGRGGKGNVYVWAGGNGRDVFDNSNYDGYANSRFTIAIAATKNTDGSFADYSEKGANLVVSIPSGSVDFGGTLDITTTDRSGSRGYNAGFEFPDPNYTTGFNGTSAACPQAAACIASILSANTSLTWRDVQHILIKSAEKNAPSDSDWTSNGAGLNINHNFGFGRVDLRHAVALAQGWSPLSVTQDQLGPTASSPGTAIPDNNSGGISDTISVSTDNFLVEHVEVKVNITHTSRGDLDIRLIAPSGTISQLAEVHVDTGDDYPNWTFMTVRHWDELAKGNWKLEVRDKIDLDTGTLDDWTLNIWGRQLPGAQSSPSISSVDTGTTNQVTQGTTVRNVTITGANFQNGAILTTNTDGVVIGPISFVNATTLQATFETDSNVTAGFYDLFVRNPDAGRGNKTNAYEVLANNPPTLGAGLGALSTTITAGTAASFTSGATDPDAGDTATSFLDFGDGTFGQAPASHVYNTPGVYTVTLYATDTFGAVTTDTLVITVVPAVTPVSGTPPTVTASFTGTTGTLPLSADFDANALDSLSAPIANLTASFGDGSLVTFPAGAVSHTYNRPGFYTVVFSATDGSGNSGSTILFVSVDAPGTSVPPSSLLTILSCKASLNFVTQGKDKLSFKGTVQLPSGFRAAGRVLQVNLCGVEGTFPLGSKGSIKLTNGSKASVKFPRTLGDPPPAGTVATIAVSFKGDLRSGLSRIGMTERVAVGALLDNEPFAVQLDGVTYTGTADLLYTVKPGTSGKAALVLP